MTAVGDELRKYEVAVTGVAENISRRVPWGEGISDEVLVDECSKLISSPMTRQQIASLAVTAMWLLVKEGRPQ